MPKSFHPPHGSKKEQFVEDGSSAFGNVMCLILAFIVVIWICHDTSAGITASLHHESPVDVLAWLGLK